MGQQNRACSMMCTAVTPSPVPPSHNTPLNCPARDIQPVSAIPMYVQNITCLPHFKGKKSPQMKRAVLPQNVLF